MLRFLFLRVFAHDIDARIGEVAAVRPDVPGGSLVARPFFVQGRKLFLIKALGLGFGVSRVRALEPLCVVLLPGGTVSLNALHFLQHIQLNLVLPLLRGDALNNAAKRVHAIGRGVCAAGRCVALPVGVRPGRREARYA